MAGSWTERVAGCSCRAAPGAAWGSHHRGRRTTGRRGQGRRGTMGIDDVQSLVARAQGGDGGAFGELYERFAPEIGRYLLRQVHGQHEAADDLTEEVFVKALQ